MFSGISNTEKPEMETERGRNIILKDKIAMKLGNYYTYFEALQVYFTFFHQKKHTK